MSAMNYGMCENCRKPVHAEHVIRDGKVFLRKNCPDCGATEAMVSSDAASWQHKRDVWHYDPKEFQGCLLNCQTCRRQHRPRMVFLVSSCAVAVNAVLSWYLVFGLGPWQGLGVAGLPTMARPAPRAWCAGRGLGLCRRHE